MFLVAKNTLRAHIHTMDQWYRFSWINSEKLKYTHNIYLDLKYSVYVSRWSNLFWLLLKEHGKFEEFRNMSLFVSDLGSLMRDTWVTNLIPCIEKQAFKRKHFNTW